MAHEQSELLLQFLSIWTMSGDASVMLSRLEIGKLPLLVQNLALAIEAEENIPAAEKEKLSKEIFKIQDNIKRLSEQVKTLFRQNVLLDEAKKVEKTLAMPREYLSDPLVRNLFEKIQQQSSNLNVSELQKLSTEANCADLQVDIVQVDRFPTTGSIPLSKIEIKSWKCLDQNSPYWTVEIHYSGDGDLEQQKSLQIENVSDQEKTKLIDNLVSAIETSVEESIIPANIPKLLPNDRPVEEFSLALDNSAYEFLKTE